MYGTPIFSRNQDSAGAFSRNEDRLIRLCRLINDPVKVGASFASDQCMRIQVPRSGFKKYAISYVFSTAAVAVKERANEVVKKCRWQAGIQNFEVTSPLPISEIVRCRPFCEVEYSCRTFCIWLKRFFFQSQSFKVSGPASAAAAGPLDCRVKAQSRPQLERQSPAGERLPQPWSRDGSEIG